MKIPLFVIPIALCLGSIPANAGSMTADHAAYVYCVGNDPGSYFSDVFVGDPAYSEKYQKAFAGFLSAEYEADPHVNVGCIFHLEKQAAINEKNRYVRATKSHGGKVMETNWSYKQ